MPKVNARNMKYPIVLFEEFIVTSVSVSEKDTGNPEPRSFYVDCIINGEETQVSISGLPASEFEKWAGMPPFPVRVQAEIHFGEYNGRVSVRLHVPALLGYAESVAGLIASGNGKQPK